MARLIRIIGLINIAIWLGGAIFFTCVVAPAFFSTKMLALFGGEGAPFARAYAGAANIIVLERYYYFNLVCGFIAFIHIFLEWLYSGQFVSRLKPAILIVVCAINLFFGVMMMPKMKSYFAQKYDQRIPAVQREAAERNFKLYHIIFWGANLVVIAGVGGYFYNLTQLPSEQRLFIK